MGGFIQKLFGQKEKSDSFKDKIILVVDDTEVDRVLLERVLSKLGCVVLTASNGQEGYNLAVERKPHLILSDCNMPGMDGVEMCRQLKCNEATNPIPVIFLTGYDSPKRVIDCFDVEAESYMCKPINAKALTTQIKTLLDEQFTSK